MHTDVLRFLNVFFLLYNVNTALFAWSASLHCACVNNPLDENKAPRYDRLLTASISSFPNFHDWRGAMLPFLKTTTFDLVVFNDYIACDGRCTSVYPLSPIDDDEPLNIEPTRTKYHQVSIVMQNILTKQEECLKYQLVCR